MECLQQNLPAFLNKMDIVEEAFPEQDGVGDECGIPVSDIRIFPGLCSIFLYKSNAFM